MKRIGNDALANVTGGAEPAPVWVTRPAMSSVPSGFNAWAAAMRQRGVL